MQSPLVRIYLRKRDLTQSLKYIFVFIARRGTCCCQNATKKGDSAHNYRQSRELGCNLQKKKSEILIKRKRLQDVGTDLFFVEQKKKGIQEKTSSFNNMTENENKETLI